MIIPNFTRLFTPRTPVILQSQYFECGLACLVMVAATYGYSTTISELRERFPVSAKGLSFQSLIKYASSLGLDGRPIRLELEDFQLVRMPIIVHWNFNHFVLVTRRTMGGFVVHDPAVGRRFVSQDEFSNSFTGIALELHPSISFKKKAGIPVIEIRSLFQKMVGYEFRLLELLALAMLLEGLNICAPLFIQHAVDTALATGETSLIKVAGLGMALLIVIKVMFQALRTWALVFFSTNVSLQLMNAMFIKAMRLPIDFFSKRSLGDVISRFESVAFIQQTLTGSMLETFLDGAMSSISLYLMFSYSSKLTTYVLVAVFVYWILRLVMVAPYRRLSDEVIARSARQQGHFIETLRGIQSIKLANRQDTRRFSWQALMISTFNASVARQRLVMPFQAANGLIFGLLAIIVAIVGADLILVDRLTVGSLLAFAAYQQQFVSRMDALVARVIDFKVLSLHKERISEIALAKDEIGSGGGTPNLFEMTGDVRVNNLCYRYSLEAENQFEGVSFHVPAGSSLAITGPSGCGKTTLLKIILGILQPNEGSVLFDGHNILDLDTATVRDQIAVVMQDDQLFSGSLSENISFFDPEPDESRIKECAQIAAIHDDIELMPMKYQTLVGDLGNTLSGGERQRILIARALYRKPRILFLDEATSHLDVNTEERVNAAISSMSITRIFVAHRLSTISSADLIFDLKNKTLVSNDNEFLQPAA